MGSRFWVFGAAVALSIPQPVFAIAFDPSLKALIDAGWPSDKFESRQSRDDLVKAAAGYCSALGRVMPNNSPSEDQWLMAEINGGGDRPSRASASPEWSRRQASNFVSDCKEFAAIYWTRGLETKGLVGLALTFSRFGPEAEKAARENKIDAQVYGPALIKYQVDPFLRAALASME